MHSPGFEYAIARATNGHALEIGQDLQLAAWRISSAIDEAGHASTLRSDGLRQEIATGLARIARLNGEQLRSLERISLLLENPEAVRAREFRNRGVWALDAGLSDEAERDLRRAIEIDPYDHVSFLHLGHLQLSTGRYGEAVANYRFAQRYGEAASTPRPGEAALDPALALSVPFWLAMAFLGQARAESARGAFGEALAAAARSVELAPTRADTHLELARSAVLAKNQEIAETAATKALRLSPYVSFAMMKADVVDFPEVAFATVQREAVAIRERIDSIATAINQSLPASEETDLPATVASIRHRLTTLRSTLTDLLHSIESSPIGVTAVPDMTPSPRAPDRNRVVSLGKWLLLAILAYGSAIIFFQIPASLTGSEDVGFAVWLIAVGVILIVYPIYTHVRYHRERRAHQEATIAKNARDIASAAQLTRAHTLRQAERQKLMDAVGQLHTLEQESLLR